MSVKLTLTFVKRTERVSKNTGNPFISLSIKAKEYGDQFLSGFGNKANENWKEGDIVEVENVQEVVKGDKKYLNFEMPKGNSNGVEVARLINELNTRVGKMNANIEKIIKHLSGEDLLGRTSAGTKVPDFSEVDDGLDQLDVEDIPL